MKRPLALSIVLTIVPFAAQALGQTIGYIHGDVAGDGTVPSGDQEAFHQMLPSDTAEKGLSRFAEIVAEEGLSLETHYDQETELTPDFLDRFDALVFGLHQKQWSKAEKQALDAWLRNGGGMLIYSDSASGGDHKAVGLKNPVGQRTVNNLISPYGLEVTVDQGGGTRSYRAPKGGNHPIVAGGVVLEGEGVSVVAVDPSKGAQVLIPLDKKHTVNQKNPLKIDAQNVTIEKPKWAALAVQEVGEGDIVVLFDRQPMWNKGPGSDITREDNTKIVRRIVRFLMTNNDQPAASEKPNETSEAPASDESASLEATASVEPVSSGATHEEQIGLVEVEAEDFASQELEDVRAWYLFDEENKSGPEPDADPIHLEGASGGAYLEILPDTRQTHDDELIAGENISGVPGKLAILSYPIKFNNSGRYYVWVRAYSTGSEDNGIHVGLDGKWPESGQRWQTTQKNGWKWDSRQRTKEVHAGVPGKLFLDIEGPGEHLIQFSMREDGFEFDKFILAKDRSFHPEGNSSGFDSATEPSPAARVAPEPAATNGSTPEPTASPTPKQPAEPLVLPRGPDGDGSVKAEGELKQWHSVMLTINGPFANENDNEPNPFKDYRLEAEVVHESGSPRYVIPGYFAADGNSAETSADAGTIWRVNVSPDKPGIWDYTLRFVRGTNVAINAGSAGEPVQGIDGKTGSFSVEATDKGGRDFRSKGRLAYVGERYLKFLGSGEYFLKAGPDAPETLLAYVDFDNTKTFKEAKAPLKKWAPHEQDWQEGNPTWKDGKGKGLIGAINYLVSKGLNSISFIPYNAGGDGDNVWPYVDRNDPLHFDCSKLAQWRIVFDYANAQGIFLHFKLQETENDDHRGGKMGQDPVVTEFALDDGNLGIERKLYLREMIARYGDLLALNWNMGEENTQSLEQQRDMIKYVAETDPYNHLRVIHTFPLQQDKVYNKLLGNQSELTGASLQNAFHKAHELTVKWIDASAKAGRQWVVANDEQGPHFAGVPPDAGYKGFDGRAPHDKNKNRFYTADDVRKQTLWGVLMAGGAGVEYYFGYEVPENDLLLEDFRSRDRSWDYCRIAIDFFYDNKIPFWEMSNVDELVGNAKHDNSRYAFARKGEIYLVYLPNGGSADLDLTGVDGAFKLEWFNPRTGGDLQSGSAESVPGGSKVSLGDPPADANEDWLAVLRVQ